MDETFYGVLGVDADANHEHIKSAYRDRVKVNHPDVSDDPKAPERFRRLTTARDVLLDEAERAKYDRMGHGEYVRHHVGDSSWAEGSTPGREATPRTKSARTHRGTGRRSAEPGNREGDRTAWLGEDWKPSEKSTTHADGGHRADGTYGGEPWQQASDTYRRSETTFASDGSRFASFTNGMKQLGGWAVVDTVFVVSALATAWFAFTEASGSGGMSAPALVGGTFVIIVVVSLSTLQLVSQLYT